MARRTAQEAAKTRAAIIDTALMVFAEKGFAASQLEDIATRAGVTRGAVYHHFVDKDELLLTVFAERWPLATAPVVEPLETKRGEDALRAFLVAYFKALQTDETLRALLTLSHSGAMPAKVEREGLAQKKAVFGCWLELLDTQLKAAGVASHTPVRARSESVLASLLGYAVLMSLAPTTAKATATVRAELILAGALG